MPNERSFTVHDGVLRVYDGTPVTPFYIELPFVEAGFKGVLGAARPEQRYISSRGRGENFPGAKHHYIELTDETVFAPQPVSWSIRLHNVDPNYQKFKAMLNLAFDATWTVGGNPWVTTKATTQRLSGGRNPRLVTTPPFAGQRKRAVDLQLLWTDPDVGGVQHMGHEWCEVCFEPNEQNYDEQDEGVMITLAGNAYGRIGEITAFRTGAAS
jgi:hypothetical protein